MKHYLNGVDLAMWITLFISQVTLCLCIIKKHFLNRLRWFSIFVFVFTAKDLVLFILAFWARYETYYYAFYIGGYLESALGFLTLIECGRQVLPGLNLPQKERAFAWLGAALGGVVIFTAAWPLPSITHERKIEVIAYLAIAVLFLFIAAYSRYLRLYWSRVLAGVTATLGLLYLVEGVVSAIMNHYPPALVAQVREIRQIVNILAVFSWIVVVLSPWGEQKMTETDLQKIELAFTKVKAGLDAEAERVEIA